MPASGQRRFNLVLRVNSALGTSASSSSVLLRVLHLGRIVKDKIRNEEKVLVEGATFDVAAGETLAIVGPSGSGKSSLLRLLNRLDEPTSGTVYLEGLDYCELPPQELRAKLGMVMQRPYLFPGTGESNLRFGPAQRGQTLTREDVERLLADVGLQGYGERNVMHLSGGEAQRVSLARTMANAPLLLLLDEPTSALDEASKIEVEMTLLKIVREKALACILVTHETSQALRLAQRALLLEAGKVVRVGVASEVLHA